MMLKLLESLAGPVLIRDSAGKIFRLRKDADGDEVPVVRLEAFRPASWNQDPEEAGDGDFVQEACWETQDPEALLEAVQDELGDVKPYD